MVNVRRQGILLRTLITGAVVVLSLNACSAISRAPLNQSTEPPQALELQPIEKPAEQASGQPVLASVSELEVVAQLTGDDSINSTGTRFNVYGTDLGHVFEMREQLYMLFGDTFGCCIPGTGGPGAASDWRSNTMAILTDSDPADGLCIDDMISDRPGHAKQLLRPGRDDKTIIPTNGVSVDDHMFIHYMAVASWGPPGEWDLNQSGLAYSDDSGQTWTKASSPIWDAQSNFGQVAFVKADGFLYLFGIPGGRFGGVNLARVDQEQILDSAAYRYFAGVSDAAPRWSPDEQDAVQIVDPPVGELSVAWNPYLGRWIMTYLDEYQAAIVIREAPELWGPWSLPLVLVSGKEYPSLYGAYMHPWLIEDSGEVIYFTMSQWGPYNVFLMRVRLNK